MLHNQKIIFVSIVDNQSRMVPKFQTRIWHHEKFVRSILESKTCLMGRWTHQNTNWHGPNTWVLTSDQNWKPFGVGVLSDINDLHLHTEGPVYVLGGQSVYHQLESYVDDIHLYVINDKNGKEEWVNLDMKEWKPYAYLNENVWSYAHLKRKVETTKYRKTKTEWMV